MLQCLTGVRWIWFSIFLLFSAVLTPLLDYTSCTTSPLNDWHQGSQMLPVYKVRYGPTCGPPYYSPNEMLNSIWKMLFKWSQKNKQTNKKDPIWFKRKLKMLWLRNAHVLFSTNTVWLLHAKVTFNIFLFLIISPIFCTTINLKHRYSLSWIKEYNLGHVGNYQI